VAHRPDAVLQVGLAGSRGFAGVEAVIGDEAVYADAAVGTIVPSRAQPDAGLLAAVRRALPGSRHAGLAGRELALYCSAEVHYSVVRAAELLGIGSGRVRALPIDERRRLRPGTASRSPRAENPVSQQPSAPWTIFPTPPARLSR